MGDAAVFSLPKTLGTAFGGLLSLAPGVGRRPSLLLRGAPRADNLEELQVHFRSAVLRLIGQLGLRSRVARWRASRRGDGNEIPIAGALPDMPADYYFSAAYDDRRAAPFLSRCLAARAVPRTIVERRRRNYLRLAAGIAGCPGIASVFDVLPDSVCPLNLPVRVSSRFQLLDLLQAAGVRGIPWWAGFHRAPLGWKDFPEASDLKNSIIALPVHQWLTDRDLDLISNAVQSVSRRLFGADDS